MFKTIALSAAVVTPRLTPVVPVAPLSAPALPRAALPAAPSAAVPVLPSLAAPSLPAAVNAAKPAAPSEETERLMARAPRMMELQAALLQVAAEKTGLDGLTLSLGMSMTGSGLSLADFDAMLTSLDELEAGLPEAQAALAREFDVGNLRGFRSETARDLLPLLAAVMRDIAAQVEIARNGRFFAWYHDYAAGRAGAADFSGARVVALPGGRFRIRFAVVDGEPVEAVLHTLGDRAPGARQWFEGIERSPLTRSIADLAVLRAALDGAGLL